MNIKNVTRTVAKRLTTDMLDVVDSDGVLREDVPAKAVMVTAETDLANLPDYQPGTLAFTAGFAKLWQLSAAGTWVEVE